MNKALLVALFLICLVTSFYNLSVRPTIGGAAVNGQPTPTTAVLFVDSINQAASDNGVASNEVRSRGDHDPVQSVSTSSHAAHAASLIVEPFAQTQDKARSWLEGLPEHYNTAQHSPIMRSYTHDRFLPFTAMATCKDIQEVGRDKGAARGFDDTSKMVCGMQDFASSPDCIIYSIGCNNQWKFEEALLELTTCHIHTFDCTGPRSRFEVPQHERLHFHHKCLASEPSPGPAEPCDEKTPQNNMCGPLETLQQLQSSLGHGRLDLLKMDMEGFEINLLRSWWGSHRRSKSGESTANDVYPNQILMELHYRAYPNMYKQLASPVVLEHEEENSHLATIFEFATAVDFVTLTHELLEMGYVVVHRDDNPNCKHCTELVLVRVADSLY